MAGNDTFAKAKSAKEDEFYTQLSDIEREMRHYRKHFKGKVVFCNCDDPFESEFFKFFVLNFRTLGLKQLLATCYSGSPIAGGQLSLFGMTPQVSPNTPYKAVVNDVYDITGNGSVDMVDVVELFKSGENTLVELEGDGDFRSAESLELMDKADIVVTNPPFSLFREYVATLMEHDKKFVIIGSMNAITYKEIFPLLQVGKMWLGYNCGDMSFRVPDHYEAKETRFWIDDDGQKWRSMGNIAWYTNLDLEKCHEDLILFRRFDPKRYPRYDNYGAIDIEKLEDIPRDYPGVMGVPLTIMQHHNPDQFELVGFGKGGLAKSIGVTKNYRGRCDIAYTLPDGTHKCPYGRVLVRNRHPEKTR